MADPLEKQVGFTDDAIKRLQVHSEAAIRLAISGFLSRSELIKIEQRMTKEIGRIIARHDLEKEAEREQGD
jgi:hypothetical protein